MTGKYWLAVAAFVIAAGCAEGPSAPQGDEHEPPVRQADGPASAADSADALTGRDWTLMRLGGEDVEPLADGRRPNLHFEPDRVYGFTGCNRVTGGYRVDGPEMEFSQLAMTRMACAEGMELEQRFSSALETVTGYAVDGGRLLLLDAGGETIAELANRQGISSGSLERVKGIEPSFSAWEADVLPLNYTRESGGYVSPGLC